MSYNFRDNDYKLADYVGGVLGRLAKAMNPTVMSTPSVKKGDYSVVPYQSTHNTGGTMTGTDPKTSVVNRYLQSWDADNLFVMGASVFPQNASRDGPFTKAKPELGYQLPLNPREFFRAGIAAANEWSRKTYGKDFDRLADADREAALKAMEAGKAEFSGFSSRMFFNALLDLSMEGFFADPIYGGNRDMAAWKMVGYPGLPATYREDIKKYFGKKYDKPPRSIADFS